MDIQKFVENRKKELEAQFNQINEVKGQLAKEIQNMNGKLQALNAEQIKIQGQFQELDNLVKEIAVPDQKADVKK